MLHKTMGDEVQGSSVFSFSGIKVLAESILRKGKWKRKGSVKSVNHLLGPEQVIE